MKITLDISKLVEEGRITPAEADRLKGLAAHETSSLGINILIGFGVIAVAAGAVALVPTPMTAIALGLGLFAAGAGLTMMRTEAWAILAQICVVVGALMFAGGLVARDNGSLTAMLIVTGAFAAGAIVARSSLLMALSVLALGACLGARAGYWHATYALAIYEPAVTVAGFSALALTAFYCSKLLPADYERLALSAARTAVIMVNFGFWIGSLWGDRLTLLRSLSGGTPDRSVIVPDYAFGIGWAIALLLVAIWGAKANRRWVVNVAAVFGAIHFYTQWFEKLGANPATVFAGGLLMLAFAIGLFMFNRRAATP